MLAVIMIISLTACGNSAPSTTNTEKSNANSGNTQTEKSETQKADNAPEKSYATQNISSTMTLINSVLDLSGYDEKIERDGKMVSLNQKATNTKPEMSLTVDGLSFTLPAKFSTFISGGWTDKDKLGDKTLDKKSITNVVFETKQGKWVTLSFANNSDESKAIKDLEAVKIQLNGSTAEAAFVIQNGIKNTSDLKEILQSGGAPSYINIQDNDNHLFVNLKYNDGEDSIDIEYTGDNNAINKVTVSCGLGGTIITY